jgi:hypothetical protein
MELNVDIFHYAVENALVEDLTIGLGFIENLMKVNVIP